MNTRFQPGRMAIGLTAFGAGVALLLSGCSSSGGSEAEAPTGEADVATAQANIDALMGVPEFVAPGPAIDISSLKGKKIFNIPISSEIPFDQVITESMTNVADEISMEFINFPNQGQSTQWVQGINQAIAQKPDLLLLQGAPKIEALGPQLQQVKDAGIPVLITHYFPSGTPLPENVDAQVFGSYTEAAEAMVDYAVAESGAETNILAVVPEEFSATAGMVTAMQDQLAELCADCKFKSVNVPIPDWATKLQGEVKSALITDDTINWVLPIFDGEAPFAAAGIESAGKTGEVKIATYNGSPAILQMIQEDGTVAMDVGESANWIGFANMDQAFRLMLGEETATEYTTPLRVFDKSNVDDAGVPPVDNKGYGDEYADAFRELWGMK